MKLTLVLLLLSLPVPAFAAPMEAGSFQKDSEGVTFALETGTLRIQVCTDKIVRVVSSPTSKIPPLENFVVIRHWTPVPFTVDESANDVTVRTRQLQVRVDRGSGAVTFLDPAGEVVLKELDGGGRRMTPVTVDGKPAFQVQQTFSSPPDERLYGLGQFQEGLWNWRGLPRELRQHNTTTVMPVLVSSRGYGLLWDNASLTDFNPLSDQVALTAQGSPNAEGNGRGPQISSWEGTFRTG